MVTKNVFSYVQASEQIAIETMLCFFRRMLRQGDHFLLGANVGQHLNTNYPI